jgi:hypothetical protein
MIQSRRNFLGAVASVVAAPAWGAGLLAAQSQGQAPRLPTPGNPFPNGPFDQNPTPEPKLSAAQRMKMNRAQIEKDMTRLKAAVGELEKEFDSNDTTTVLSMAAVRKTEEIEKLARHIRELVRG